MPRSRAARRRRRREICPVYAHRRPWRTHCDQHDFRGDAEAERHQAAAEAAGDDDVAVHADVAIGELLPGRGDRRPAQQRTWPPWVWPESCSETRAVTRLATSGSCAIRITGASSVTFASVWRLEIVDADAATAEAARRHRGKLIARPPARTGDRPCSGVWSFCKPGMPTVPSARPAIVGPCPSRCTVLLPRVVIAENRMHVPSRAFQSGKHACPLAGGNVTCHLVMSGHVVAKHDDHVRLERVGACDNLRMRSSDIQGSQA